MKAERRHELQDNQLANWLGQHLEQVKPYTKTIVAVLLLAAAAGIAGSYAMRDQAARAQMGWHEYFNASNQRNTEALSDVAKHYPGTEAAIWAKLAEADINLTEGLNRLFRSRGDGKDLLGKAQAAYMLVDGSTASNQLARERAWFGLGQVYEAQASLDEAKTYYAKLVASSADSALGKESQRRIDELDDPAVEKWYNWFANQEARAPMNPNMPGLPGNPDLPDSPDLPFDLGTLPDRPDISLPKPLGPPTADEAEAATVPEASNEKKAPAPEPPSPTEGSAEPADGDAKPPTPPNPDSPEATPKSDSAPAEEKPADSPPAEKSPDEGEE